MRVSAVRGRDGDRFRSPLDQEQAIRRWVEARGDRVEVLPAELDRSGGDDTRPVLEQAIGMVEQGSHGGLVVAYLSRAARSVRHTLEIYERIDQAGGRLVAVAENIDVSTSDGRFMRTIHAAVAEQELDRHRERFAAQRAAACARGIWSRRQAPLGYERDPVSRRLVPSDQADVVRDVFARRGRGETWASLARLVGMSGTGVRRLVANRVYLGELRDGPHENLVAHEALVSTRVWEAAQAPPRVPRGRSSVGPALLAKLVRCGSCGRLMSRGGSSRRVYTCQTHGPCTDRAVIQTDRLDEYVSLVALGVLQSRVDVRRSAAADTAKLEDAVDRAQAELAAYLGAVSAADVGADAFAAGARSRREALDVARGALAEAHEVDALPVGIGEMWPELSDGEKGRVLRGFLEAVVVWPAHRRTLPVSERVQLLRAGAGVVVDFRVGPAEVQRPVVPIVRFDSSDPRVAGPVGHDGSEGVGSAL